ERLARRAQRWLGRPIGARQAEGPGLAVVTVPVPLVRPGEHERPGASRRHRRADLPIEGLRLGVLAVAQAVETQLAHEERPVAGEVLQPGEIGLELRLRLEV